MTLAEKAQSFIILAAVFAGLVLGSVPWAQQHAVRLIVPLLMLMLTGVFLHVPLKGFADVFQYRSVAFVSLGINFIWTPLLAIALVAFPDMPLVAIALVIGPLINHSCKTIFSDMQKTTINLTIPFGPGCTIKKGC